MHPTLILCSSLSLSQGDPGGIIGGFIPQKGDRGFPGTPGSQVSVAFIVRYISHVFPPTHTYLLVWSIKPGYYCNLMPLL